MLIDIKDRHIFGVPEAQIHVIEFQKWGHPHAHLIITLSDNDKIRGSDIIDQLIIAEIPDPVSHNRLHEKVKNYMLHGPCRIINPHLPCMQNEGGKYSKNFPRTEFVSETIVDEDGFANYNPSSSSWPNYY